MSILKKWPFWVTVAIVALVLAFVACGKSIWIWSQQVFTTPHSATVVFTNVFALILGALLLVGSYYLGAVEPVPDGGDIEKHASCKFWRIGRNLFATLLGALLGWTIALIYTPFGPVDAESINTLVKTVSVFASGYLVSKLDRFLEGTLFENNKPTIQWVPLGLFGAAFLLSTIVVFVNRIYTDDVSQFSVFSFFVPNGNVEMVLGADRVSLGNGKLAVNGTELEQVTTKPGDFIKISPRTREIEINGRNFGTLPRTEELKNKRK